MTEEKFWMVQGKGPATVRHNSKAVALNEARRLLESNNAGGQVYVMEAVAIVRLPRPPLEVIDLNTHACEKCGQSVEPSRPRSKKCRACDRA